MAGNSNTAFRFRVTLRLDGRECWREILVPASLTFFDLHAVLQECFMWYGEHLFCFCATFPDGKQVQVEELWGEEPSYHEAKYEQYMPVEPLPEVRIARKPSWATCFPRRVPLAITTIMVTIGSMILSCCVPTAACTLRILSFGMGRGMRLRRMSAGCMGSSGSLIPWAIPKMKNMMAWLSGPRIRCGIVSR